MASKGSSRFVLDPHALGLAADASTEKLVDTIAKKVEAAMKRLAPVETSALQRSITTETSGEGIKRVAKIGVAADFVMSTIHGIRRPEDYWEFVERGTSRAPAQPFIKPALLQVVSVL